MDDGKLRALERRWRAGGAEADYQRWLVARARVRGCSIDALRSLDALRERGAAWAEERWILDEHFDGPDGEQAAAGGELLARACGPLAAPLLGLGLRPRGDLAVEFFVLGEEVTRLGLEREGQADRPADWFVIGAALSRLIADETRAEDAWYYELEDRLEGLLEALEDPGFFRFENLAEYCFTSWVLREDDPVRYGGAVALARALGAFEERYGAPSPGIHRGTLPSVPAGGGREAALPHLLVASSMDWDRPPGPVSEKLCAPEFLETGAQERYQRAVDALVHRGDADRQSRFAAALGEARRLAEEGELTGLDALSIVQAELLSEGGARVRTRPALAKRGAEVYASFPALERLLRAKLAADLSDACHPIVQAGRLYLDVIFLHPFEDGNARLARLALELVLRRARLPTPELAALVALEKRAGDPESYWGFIEAIADGVALSARR